MNEADTPPAQGNQDPTAGSELSVPKYRLDEVSARLRRAEEELQYKDQILTNYAAQNQPQQVEEELTAEQLGIDPDTFKAAKMIAGKEIAVVEEKYRGQIGVLANSVEETRFLQSDPNAAPFLERAKEYRKRHLQVTGTFLDLRTAYQNLRWEEAEQKRAKGFTPAPAAAPAAAAPHQAPPVQATPEAVSTQAVNAAPQPQAKTFGEMSLEDMENQLDSDGGAV